MDGWTSKKLKPIVIKNDPSAFMSQTHACPPANQYVTHGQAHTRIPRLKNQAEASEQNKFNQQIKILQHSKLVITTFAII